MKKNLAKEVKEVNEEKIAKKAESEACPKADKSKKCTICEKVKTIVNEKVKITPELKQKAVDFAKKNSSILIAVAATFAVTAFLGKTSADKRVAKARRRR